MRNLLTKYSSWLKLLRVWAWLLKFSQWISFVKASRASVISKIITTKEIEMAKRGVVALVQQEVYPVKLKSV